HWKRIKLQHFLDIESDQRWRHADRHARVCLLRLPGSSRRHFHLLYRPTNSLLSFHILERDYFLPQSKCSSLSRSPSTLELLYCPRSWKRLLRDLPHELRKSCIPTGSCTHPSS